MGPGEVDDGMPVSTEQSFAGTSKTPAAARRFATSAVAMLLGERASGSVCDDVELVVSELVTNAVRAGSPTIDVSIAVENARVVVRVADRGSGWPEERIAGIHDTGGRGLALVSALSAAWGVRMASAGKVVWSEIQVR